MNPTDIIAALGLELDLGAWSLSGNQQFPRPVSNDGDGNVI